MQLARKLISAELEQFNRYLQEATASEVLLTSRIIRYITQHRGKQMRPMFVLLSAAMGGEINESSYRAALFAEILHTSSLVHDDLVDESDMRRGAYSVNALWNNKTAVFLGDTLFTQSILLLLQHGEHRILEIYAGAIGQIIEGELLQLEKSSKLNLSEDVYYDIIKGKTATLLAACCAAGAASTFSSEEAVLKMGLFGEKTGIAFQIKDDLLDYGSTDIGKPTGNDIRERKITLPLIYTINSAAPALRKQILHILHYQNTDKAQVAFIVNEVQKAGGIQYAEEKMIAYRNEALEVLQSFPPSQTRDALEELLMYATERVY